MAAFGLDQFGRGIQQRGAGGTVFAGAVVALDETAGDLGELRRDRRRRGAWRRAEPAGDLDFPIRPG